MKSAVVAMKKAKHRYAECEENIETAAKANNRWRAVNIALSPRVASGAKTA